MVAQHDIGTQNQGSLPTQPGLSKGGSRNAPLGIHQDLKPQPTRRGLLRLLTLPESFLAPTDIRHQFLFVQLFSPTDLFTETRATSHKHTDFTTVFVLDCFFNISLILEYSFLASAQTDIYKHGKETEWNLGPSA